MKKIKFFISKTIEYHIIPTIYFSVGWYNEIGFKFINFEIGISYQTKD